MVNGKREAPQLKIEIAANRSVSLHSLSSVYSRITFRYDMLCFEGISLMLNIFNQKQQSPKYQLKAPATGKLESITATEDVSHLRKIVAATRTDRVTTDCQDTTVCLRGYPPQYKVYEREIRFLHCPPRQASPESGTTANVSGNWHSRSRYN